MKNQVELHTVVSNLSEQIARADKQFDDWVMTHDDWLNPDWMIESSFIHLLTILEALDVPELRKMVDHEYQSTKASSSGFSATEIDPFGDTYSPVLGKVRRYVSALESLLPSDNRRVVTKDLLDIIRNIHYVITDKAVFSEIPQNEKDVHLRIEAILKCVFPDLVLRTAVRSRVIENRFSGRRSGGASSLK